MPKLQLYLTPLLDSWCCWSPSFVFHLKLASDDSDNKSERKKEKKKKS